MANAETQSAPLKKKGPKKQTEVIKEKQENGEREQAFLDQVFDIDKSYVFELAVENSIRDLPVIDVSEKRPYAHKKHKPYQNMVYTSQIVWNGSRKNIRYYDGCESIFVSEQPLEKETIDQLIKQTRRRHFQDGKFVCKGDERQLLLYLYACSWNTESPFRTSTATGIFLPLDKSKIASKELTRLDQAEKALQYAKEATDTKMLIHAAYLGIPDTDWDSGNKLESHEIRMEYRKWALNNPSKFIESYGNKSLEVKYYIDKALRENVISNKHNPNKATWGSANKEICDISGLKSHDAISDRLYEFSQTEAGEEFLIQIKSLYSN